MKIEHAVLAETKKVAAGTAVMTALMIAVFLILRKFDFSVLLGAVIGSLAAIGNFFLMALSVQKAADSMPPLPPEEAEGEDPGEDKEEKEKPLSEEAKNAKKTIKNSKKAVKQLKKQARYEKKAIKQSAKLEKIQDKTGDN